VTVLGVLYIIGGALSSLSGLILIVAASMIGSASRSSFLEGIVGAIVGAAVVIGVIVMLLGSLYIWAGASLIAGKNWARVLALVLAWIGAIFSVLSVFGSLFTLNPIGLIWALFLLGIDIFVIVRLNSPTAKSFFAKRGFLVP
jgi:hypothetical protein